LENWGRRVGAGSRTLAGLFRSETGMTFRQWRPQVKILEALRRLGEGDAATTMAIDPRYGNPSTFIFMHEKSLGKTPDQYSKG